MVNYLNLAQIKQAKAILSKNDKSKRDTLLFMLGINTGLRASDLLNLTYERLQKRSLTMQKTKKSVRLLVPKELMEAVSTYCRENNLKDTDLLFTTCQKRNGGSRARKKAMSYHRLHDIMKEIGAELGLNLGTHTMRKTYGRIIYNKTKDINIVAELLGHTNSTSTIKYIGLTDDLLNNVREEVGLIG